MSLRQRFGVTVLALIWSSAVQQMFRIQGVDLHVTMTAITGRIAAGRF